MKFCLSQEFAACKNAASCFVHFRYLVLLLWPNHLESLDLRDYVMAGFVRDYAVAGFEIHTDLCKWGSPSIESINSTGSGDSVKDPFVAAGQL